VSELDAGWATPSDPLAGDGWSDQPMFDVDDSTRVNVATGEVDEVVDAELIDDDELTQSAQIELLPIQLAQQGGRAVQLFRDPEAVAQLTHNARVELLRQLDALAADARSRRPDGRVTSSTIAPEVTLMADAHDTLRAIVSVFDAGVQRTRSISGELAVELVDDPRRQSSLRVGDAHGGDVKVTRTQPTEMRIDADAIIDVIVAELVDELGSGHVAFARGARDAIALYRSLTAAHTFKSSALDEHVRSLESRELFDLALRLGHAYGRVSKGDAQVKIERVERSKRGAS
jgi:hypothetical protein